VKKASDPRGYGHESAVIGASAVQGEPPHDEPAFPIAGGLHEHQFAGMSLRDYAAIHSTQPGISEIVKLAGLRWSVGRVWESETVSLGSFDVWWESLSLARRLELSAQVRYAQADAMLKARLT
jgi:hypothetical protein